MKGLISKEKASNELAKLCIYLDQHKRWFGEGTGAGMAKEIIDNMEPVENGENNMETTSKQGDIRKYSDTLWARAYEKGRSDERAERWTLWAEKKPEKDGLYLWFIRKGDGSTEYKVSYLESRNGNWNLNLGTFPFAWMPLSEPGKENKA